MKLYLTALLSLLYIAVIAQSKKEIAITGNFPKEANKVITITGQNHFKQTVTADGTGLFKVIFKTEPAYYLLRYSNGGYFVYAEPGMNLTVTKIDSLISFTGKGSEQNNLIKDIAQTGRSYMGTFTTVLPARITHLEPTEFNDALDKYRSAVLLQLNSQHYSEFFTKTQTDYINYKIKEFAYSYLNRYGIDPEKEKVAMDILTHRSAGPATSETMSKFSAALIASRVKTMPLDDRNKFEQLIWENFDLNNEVMFTYSQAYNMLHETRITQMVNASYTLAPYLRSQGLYVGKYEMIKKEVANNSIKQNLLAKNIVLILKAGKDVDKYYQDYLTVATDEVYKDEVKEVYNSMQLYAPGSPAPEFAYNDMNQNKVTLSSLKGNYVYIDIWAQWCGPCKGEIPSLKEIEKKYEGQNIKFVSLSIDKMEDIDKWKKYVTDNKLTGIQLIADKEWNSDFTKRFNVNSIPRFILIDPEGKIVNPNADRPSNPKLQVLLDKLLTKS